MNRTDTQIMQRLQEHLAHYKEHYDHEWVGLFLQGSQNYGLAYEGSDIDTKIIILPKFENVVLNHSPVSTTSILPNNEHLDVKDVRLMFDCFRKQNINFLEILFTPYCIINPKYSAFFQPLLDARERIARYNNYAAIHCMGGMVSEKRKLLTKVSPSSEEVIRKYGYDGKQLHHMERLLEFIGRYAAGEPYVDCLKSNQREYMLSLKKHELQMEDAIKRADDVVRLMDEAIQQYKAEHELAVDNGVVELLNRTTTGLIRRAFEVEFDRAGQF